MIKKTKWIFCWRCAHKSCEWLGFKVYWERRGRCFYCRMDLLDKKYGPSLSAELNKVKGQYRDVEHTSKWPKIIRRIYGN